MPPRIPRASVGLARSFRKSNDLKHKHICPICSISPISQRPPGKARQPKPKPLLSPITRQQRYPYATSNQSPNDEEPRTGTTINRDVLRDALLEIQKNATNFVNISRLQLALRGLEQPEGQETIRIAILGLANRDASLRQAKELLRLILADPLKEEEEWERGLLRDDHAGRPLLIRVGHNAGEVLEQNGRLIHEVNVSSPMFNEHKLEILVLEMDPPIKDTTQSFEEAVLVPTMEIPTSSSGRYTPVTTPVHKSFLLGQGIMGAASLLSYPLNTNTDVVGSAVDLCLPDNETIPLQVVDIAAGNQALLAFRKSIDNALSYEHEWFSSGIPQIIDWLKSGTFSTQNTIKEPLFRLIASVIENADSQLEAERARQISRLLSTKVSTTHLGSLRHGLSIWSQRAHTELRDQLDLAFGGQRWRKLGWWKLFWRVDDVSMITSDMLNRRFLVEAEKELIFLVGRINEVLIYSPRHPLIPQTSSWAYKPVDKVAPKGVPPPNLHDLVVVKPVDESADGVKPQPWPLDIPVTRAFLSSTTIPALQALAQKLVLQTLTTSSVSSALAGLMYVSSLSTTMYEAGAVAAFGIVWSLRRMQNKWETARKYWEGEVREEGRKAVRSIETIVGENLNEAEKEPELDPVIQQDLEKASTAIKSADAIIR